MLLVVALVATLGHAAGEGPGLIKDQNDVFRVPTPWVCVPCKGECEDRGAAPSEEGEARFASKGECERTCPRLLPKRGGCPKPASPYPACTALKCGTPIGC